MKFNNPDKIFYSSDFHFGHRGICRGTSEWEASYTRDFDTVEEHDQLILENINKTVPRDGILFFDGDFTLGNYRHVKEYRNQIRCETIHFIFGNHDGDLKQNRKNCRSLFTTCQPKLEIIVNEQHITLDHYANRVFNHWQRGSWNLYGHSHGGLGDYEMLTPVEIDGEKYYKPTGQLYLALDCGLESAKRFLGELRPFSHKEVEDIMLSREWKRIRR